MRGCPRAVEFAFHRAERRKQKALQHQASKPLPSDAGAIFAADRFRPNPPKPPPSAADRVPIRPVSHRPYVARTERLRHRPNTVADAARVAVNTVFKEVLWGRGMGGCEGTLAPPPPPPP